MKIYTDSRITLSSLKNLKNKKFLIEEIRKKTIALEKENWHIEFTWIRAHVRHSGNKLADKLAKGAANNSVISLNKIPKSEIVRLERQKSTAKRQHQWDNCINGHITKEYFPEITDRLKMHINLTPNFTAMVTAHGKTKAYLH